MLTIAHFPPQKQGSTGYIYPCVCKYMHTMGCDPRGLTTVVFIAAVGAVHRVVTPPGVRNAPAVPAAKLRWFARLHVQPRQTTQLPRLVPAVPAVHSSVTQLLSGQTLVGRPAGESRAVVAGHLIAAVTAVVRTVAAEEQGDAASAAAGKFIFSTQQLTCDVTNTVTNISAENTTNICRFLVFSLSENKDKTFSKSFMFAYLKYLTINYWVFMFSRVYLCVVPVHMHVSLN